GEEAGAKRDTHYAPLEEEARVVRSIYNSLVKERLTLSVIARSLTEDRIPPPKSSRTWDASLVRILIRNPVYKGEFYAHRYTYEKRFSKRLGKEVMRKVERPSDEWIKVEVPHLVPAEMWDMAQKVLSDNKLKSPRNARTDYLLLGLTVCADCNPIKMSTGRRKYKRTTRSGPKEYQTSCYRCQTKATLRYKREAFGRHCTMPQIASRRLDEMVWDAVISILLDRERLQEGMERYFSRQKMETVAEEHQFLQSQLTTLELEDERLYQAYMAQAFDADEYAQRRRKLRERQEVLRVKKDELQRQLESQVSAAARTKQKLSSVDEIKRQAGEATPFELRRRVILKVVDRIIVNTREEWFELEGTIAGKFTFGTFDVNPVGRGSAPQSA
ncbi:MAG TPA: recombinase family protein, partial [Roseiflexaceae bacterium]|nr:recombinase family protein [Roseiflexaceae bacterium]